MKSAYYRNLQDLLVFLLLVGIGVAGRWGQPAWCFTPTAAVAIFAGWYFARLAVAAMVPVAVLAISDLLLPAYDSIPVLLATYGIMAVPVVLGHWQRSPQTKAATAARWVLFSIVPATLFYVVTNLAVWAFYSTYEKSFAGLLQCYWAAVPFYRTMLAGDAFYVGVLLICAAAAGMPLMVRHPAELSSRA
jgi:hypothetical protein